MGINLDRDASRLADSLLPSVGTRERGKHQLIS